ncbi:alpha/beta fold hydrolase [Streptomyces yaizuensis]|uniref:Alpha/beta hydrolase n=1 Tax=Streptomyces yaizuensis TaxID=2989713 RepID=A0ABQ5NXF4_9ACTN|nr:alpha/beta fold hydrolase [Streptomyces sp. YSPA8]GLF95054.1 alpha/beta hydrolase [Streptomyces sp. YSPA8]
MTSPTLPEATYARTRLGSGSGLVLAHGAGSSVDNTWGPLLDGLTAGHTVVGVDYPGSGGTPRSPGPLSLDDLADQLVAGAEAEGLRTFALAGYSLGGLVAMRAAARHPERVTVLVLTATMPYRDTPLALKTSVWRQLAELGNRRLLAEFLLPVGSSPRALDSYTDDQIRDALAFAGDSAADGTPEQAELAGRADVRGDLASIKAPTLVISTTADQLVRPVLHQQLVTGITGAERAEIDAGHLVMVERPREWLQLITAFLDRHHA